jgi:hypothetical protein
VELAGKIAESVGQEVAPGEVLGPDAPDAAWASWLAGHARGQEDSNPYINAFGLAFGAYLVDRLGLAWKVVSDKDGPAYPVDSDPEPAKAGCRMEDELDRQQKSLGQNMWRRVCLRGLVRHHGGQDRRRLGSLARCSVLR